jgi:hypothetical protein
MGSGFTNIPPEKTQQITIFFGNTRLMEHAFYVRRESMPTLLESM